MFETIFQKSKTMECGVEVLDIPPASLDERG